MTDEEKREMVIRGLETCVQCRSSKDCDGCPYEGERTYAVPCGHVLMADALTLLKEQEPRVLSRSEAESYYEVVDCYSEKNPLYVEYQKPHPYNLRWATNETVRAWMSDFEISRDYGIDFRFWTSRPNDKQRKEAKWE